MRQRVQERETRCDTELSKNFITGCYRDWGLGVTSWCAPAEQSLETDRVGSRQVGQRRSGGIHDCSGS